MVFQQEFTNLKLFLHIMEQHQKELIVKKSIISISCYHFMVSQRMPLPKRSLEHEGMTSSDLGLNVI